MATTAIKSLRLQELKGNNSKKISLLTHSVGVLGAEWKFYCVKRRLFSAILLKIIGYNLGNQQKNNVSVRYRQPICFKIPGPVNVIISFPPMRSHINSILYVYFMLILKRRSWLFSIKCMLCKEERKV